VCANYEMRITVNHSFMEKARNVFYYHMRVSGCRSKSKTMYCIVQTEAELLPFEKVFYKRALRANGLCGPILAELEDFCATAAASIMVILSMRKLVCN
jgi:hypothetical protein